MLTTADGQPLKQALAKAQAKAKIKAFLLVLPLLAFVVVSFIIPIGQLLFRAAYNPAFSDEAPHLVAWFAANPAGTAPNEAAFEALVADLKQMAENQTQGSVGARVNYDFPGARSLFTSSAREVDNFEPPYQSALSEFDEEWQNPDLWQAMRGAASPYTTNFFLAALDLKRDAVGQVQRADPEQRVYVMLYGRTLALSLAITLLCLALGFPIAHLLANLPMRQANILMILVLLPFWTSLLVRTTAWMVLLQSQGVVNDILVFLGLIDDKHRLAMMYNQTGTLIAMTHILLPFMVLPLYSVMRPIPPSLVRAARSLGASSWLAFRRVYLPQTIPGIAAGSLLVFILAIGYYITPALVGGAEGQLISNLIAFHMHKTLNWSLAAALSTILLVGVLILYWLYDRLIGIDRLRLG